MALSGTFYGTTSNEYIEPKIVWSATQSVSGNYSTVTATLYYSRTNKGYTTEGSGSYTLTINGNAKTETKRLTLTYNSNTKAISHTVQVSHAADGSKSITIKATGSIPGSTFTSTTISATVTLDTIPRATTPTVSAASVNMGSAVTINTPRASSSFTHTLAYSFAGSSYTNIATGVGTSYSWTVPDLASKIPNATSGTVSIRCITYNGSTQIGTKTVSMTAKVPSSVVPTISSVALAEAVSSIGTQFNVYVQGKSKVKATITAAGAKGSTIKSYSSTLAGQTYTGASWTSGVLTSSGSFTVTAKVTDSRGRTATKTASFTVTAYSAPKVTAFTAYRSDASGAAKDDGTYVTVKYKYTVPTLGGGNTAAMKIEYKRSADTEWTSLLTGSALTADTKATPQGVTFSVDYQYDLRLSVTDYFKAEGVYLALLPSGAVILDLAADGKGIAFGKTADRSGVDFGWSAKGAVLGLWEASAEVPENGDLNDLRVPGVYTTFNNARTATIANCPSTNAGTVRVWTGLGTERINGTYVYLLQEYRPYVATEPTYRRQLTTNASGAWSYGRWVSEGATAALASYGAATTS